MTLPTKLPDASYDRIRNRLEARQQKLAYWAGLWAPPELPTASPPPPPPSPPLQVRTAGYGMQKFARIEDVTAAGFTRIASGMYRKAHDIWELRRADDPTSAGAGAGGYNLVRKREERAVDLRDIGVGAQAAIASGIVRTAQRTRDAKAPPGAKWERLTKKLKHDPSVDNPFAVAWSQYDKAKEGAEHSEAEAKAEGHETCGCSHVGMRVLAVRQGQVSEGVIIKILPMSDMMVDFGEGPEETPLDLILDPILDPEELALEVEDVAEGDASEADEDDDDEDDDDEGATKSKKRA